MSATRSDKYTAERDRFKESCDLYFSVDLSKQRLKELIGELEELHDQMRTGLKRGT